MESKSTHGLRLDQLAELLRIAAAETDISDTTTSGDKTDEPSQKKLPHRVPDPPKRPGTSNRKIPRDDAS